MSAARTFTVTIVLAVGAFGSLACGQSTAPSVLKTEGPVPTPSVSYSPDRQFFVAWVDINAPLPIGTICPLVFRSSRDEADLFSVVVPQDGTKMVAWNPLGTGCLITDQPDNGTVFAWLVSKASPGERWHGQKLDFLAPVYALYRQAASEKATPLFRPYLEKIEWLSNTRVRFLVWSNLNAPELASAGRYFVTVDTQKLEAEAALTKLPPE